MFSIYFQSWWVVLKHRSPYIGKRKLAIFSNAFYNPPKEMLVLAHGRSGFREQLIRQLGAMDIDSE